MKAAILFALVVACAAASDYSRYEQFNVDEMIQNKRLLSAYSACFIGPGKCTPEGNDFKKWIPEAIQNNCESCSENQKHMVGKVMRAIKEQLPEDWDKLTITYNKERKFDKSLQAFVKKYGY